MPLINLLYAGTDVRVPIETCHQHWTDERRALFLLRRGVRNPLSTDTSVWPGAPEHEDSEGPQSWIGPDEVAQEAAEYCDGGVVLACGLHVESQAEAAHALQARGLDSELVVRPAWRLVGYDVTDAFLTSGLANCGYKLEDRKKLELHWAERLNEHGLFDDVRDAAAFRELTNLRVREHQPSCVHGLWVVDEFAPRRKESDDAESAGAP